MTSAPMIAYYYNILSAPLGFYRLLGASMSPLLYSRGPIDMKTGPAHAELGLLQLARIAP
jgi:hypothetical protein